MKLKSFFFVLGITSAILQPASAEPLKNLDVFPKKLTPNCGDKLARLYDECVDQRIILKDAIDLAKKQNKKVLVIYGGEWCIWCHVFDKYIKGEVKHFDYQWRAEPEQLARWEMEEAASKQDQLNAIKLNNYVADHFVIAHIEGDMTNGKEALKEVGMTNNIYAYPEIMLINNGKYVASLPSERLIKGLEVRESGGQEYRGYNRKILLEQLKILNNK